MLFALYMSNYAGWAYKRNKGVFCMNVYGNKSGSKISQSLFVRALLVHGVNMVINALNQRGRAALLDSYITNCGSNRFTEVFGTRRNLGARLSWWTVTGFVQKC